MTATLPLSAPTPGSLPLHTVRPADLSGFLQQLPAAQAAYLQATGFAAKAHELALLPGTAGLSGAVAGLGDETGPYAYGGLALGLPENSVWHLAGTVDTAATADAVLGFCLGAYRFAGFRTPKRAPAHLVQPPGTEAARHIAEAIWLGRDLINTPANALGPAELAQILRDLAGAFGATAEVTEGPALEAAYPTIALVGRGSARAPRVATLRWQGSTAGPDAPLVSLCGKGVCFDSGGYDLKPAAGMLRMKKDMGGAAITLALARLVMQADLPVRLVARIGCVENMVSADAMRPLDIVRTRRGLTVEIGNTDAEGRLVLCDLLAEASDEKPDLLIDFATLTGAARVALGPDLPALFCNDDALAARLLQAGQQAHDPLWRLPLWAGYDAWLESGAADLNNTASKPMAGSITAALYLQRFLAPATRWAHIDVYCWNDSTRPGRPEGAELQSLHAIFTFLYQFYANKRAKSHY